MKIPESLHPLEVANDALKLGQLAGVVKVWAQNGSVWDIKFTDATEQKAITSSVIQVVFKKILDNAPAVIKEVETDEADDEAAAEALLSQDEVQGDDGSEIDPPADEPSGSDLDETVEDVAVSDEEGEIIAAEVADISETDRLDMEADEELPEEEPKG